MSGRSIAPAAITIRCGLMRQSASGSRRAALPGADEIAVVDAIGGRSRHHPPAGGFHRAHDALRPIAPASAFDYAAAMDELAADLGMVVDEEHYASRAGGGGRCGETRGAARRRRADRSAR